MKNHSKKISLGILSIGILIFIGWSFLTLRSGESTVDSVLELVPFTLVEVDRDGPQDIYSKGFGDLNGNDLKDLIAGGNQSGGGGLVWYENPEWTRHDIDTEYRIGTDIEVVDVNGNGLLDVIAIRHMPDRALVWYENPDWTQHLIAEGALHDIEVADFDGDGNVEIVARYQALGGSSGATLFLYKQDGSPTSLWLEHSFPIPEGEGLKAADINGNGRMDVVVNENWYENTGTFLDEAAWRKQVLYTGGSHSMRIMDINNNGAPDLFGANWRGKEVLLWVNLMR